MPRDLPDSRGRFVLAGQLLMACGLVVAIAVPAAAVGTLNIVGPGQQPTAPTTSAPDGGSLVAAAPVEPTVEEVSISGIDPKGLRALPGRVGGAALGARRSGKVLAALTEPAAVTGYATVGVTWDHGVEVPDDDITVDIRTRSADGWSEWQPLSYHDEHGPDLTSAEAARARPGTDPMVVGNVDDVQVRAVTVDGEVPDDMSLALVDPGETVVTTQDPEIDTATLSSADTDTDTGTGTGTGTRTGSLAGAPADVTAKPQIFSRAQWGADERMRDKSSLHYGEVHAGFVHHTVNANGYTKEQVPAIIRGIYAYHTQSQGWSDVGYNYLVDRFGRIWEGRFGGVDRPVVGAHTLNYNENSFAMSAIGNFETAQPSKAMLRAYGRLFAWKLSLHGVDASSARQRVGSRDFRAINGHRDAGSTACPGRNLYAKLSTIRTLARKHQRPWSARQRMTDISGTRHPDLVVRDKDSKKAYVVRTGGLLGFGPAKQADTGWGKNDLLVAPGDVTGDGLADMMGRDASSKVTSVYPGDGAGQFGDPTDGTDRFAGMDQLTGVGDFDGDGTNDLVGRRAADNQLLLFSGDAAFRDRRQLDSDWSGYNLTIGVGDFDGDGNRDLAARDGDGALWLVPGNGKGAIGTPVAIGGTWTGYDKIAGMGDLSNDGEPDLLVRVKSSKTTYVLTGTGTGAVGGRQGGFTALESADFMVAAGQVAGNKAADIVGRNSKGKLVVLANSGGSNIHSTTRAGFSIASANLLLNVGDWDGDGNADVMTRSSKSGSLYLRPGNGQGRFGDPARAGEDWGSVRLVAAVGDITGDGFPDLMGQPAGGSMRIYPGDGSTGFRTSYVAHSAISANSQVGVGLWDDDGSPDVLLRQDGKLRVYSGNGPGGLTSTREVGSGAAGFSWLVSAGFVNGDARPDLLGRSSDGKLWLLPGNRTGGFDKRRLLAGGFNRFDLVG